MQGYLACPSEKRTSSPRSASGRQVLGSQHCAIGLLMLRARATSPQVCSQTWMMPHASTLFPWASQVPSSTCAKKKRLILVAMQLSQLPCSRCDSLPTQHHPQLLLVLRSRALSATRRLQPAQAPQSFTFYDDDFDIHMGTNATRLALQRGELPAEYAAPPFSSPVPSAQSPPLHLVQHRRVVAAGRRSVRQTARTVPLVRELSSTRAETSDIGTCWRARATDVFIDKESKVILHTPAATLLR